MRIGIAPLFGGVFFVGKAHFPYSGSIDIKNEE
jgi:hypothetical protein